MKNQKIEITQGRRKLEKERRGELISETNTRTQLKLNRLIQSISNPAKRKAAREAYGGLYA